MKIGTNDISKIYLGGSEINSIYLGTTQVYSGDTSNGGGGHGDDPIGGDDGWGDQD